MKQPAHTRILIITENNLQLEAWKALLVTQPYLMVAGGYTSAFAVDSIDQHPPPQAFLMDLRNWTPGEIQQLKQHAPDSGILFLVDRYDPDEILSLLKAGASGVMDRGGSVPDLVSALIAVGRGEYVLPPAYAAAVLRGLITGEKIRDRSIEEDLTDRETDVLELLAEGNTNKAIAQGLFISVRTVEAHLRSIYAKLGVSTRTEAVLWAVEHGYGESQDLSDST